MKKILGLLLTAVLTIAVCVPSMAEDIRTDGWYVKYVSSKQLDSNFKTADIDTEAKGLQPGDTLYIDVDVINASTSEDAAYYMENKVIESLEDASKVAEGGAYSYKLTYSGPDGSAQVLFDSMNIGGDYADGLHDIESALENYFYLDTIKVGQKGKVSLQVSLDGETQGNDYQDTLGQLMLTFAVEPQAVSQATNQTTKTRIVKTGDDNNMLPYFGMMAAAGIILLFVAIFRIKNNKKEEA